MPERKGDFKDIVSSFPVDQLERYSQRYDEIFAMGLEQNKQTKGCIAKKEEKALLNRLKKYKENHLLFLYDFQYTSAIT
jgi:transposase